jgi:hypothetical protein
MGGAIWPVPELLQTAALFFVYLVLSYLLIGLGLVQGFGQVALTLGAVSARQAFVLGWNFFRRHFELVGFKLVSLLIELILVLPLLAAVVALSVILPSGERWLAALAAVVATVVGGALYGAGTAVWWQTVYRGLVHRGHPGGAMSLLNGRKPERARRGAVVGLVTLVILVAALATAWPWLPLSALGL